MNEIRTLETITEKGLLINLPELNEFIGERVEVIISPIFESKKQPSVSHLI